MSRLRDLLIKIKLLKGPFTSFTHAVFFFLLNGAQLGLSVQPNNVFCLNLQASARSHDC